MYNNCNQNSILLQFLNRVNETLAGVDVISYHCQVTEMLISDSFNGVTVLSEGTR